MTNHWKQTPTLDEFAKMYDEDDNIWWRIACGHHQNLYEVARERYEKDEATIKRVREVAQDQCFFAQALGTDGLMNVVSVEAIYVALDGAE